jgi:gliding motility-associated-like protein/uncharacterized repeat protein (TIGR01451 family)
MSKIYILLFWLTLPCLLLSQHEICGDGIDNDFDGMIDEACQPFECDGSLYQSAKQGSSFILYKVLVNPVQFIQVANLSQNGVTDKFNALAYNPVDNLMYGMGLNDSRVYRIDATGAVEFLGIVAGLPDGTNAGTCDAAGNYYIFCFDDVLRKINLSTLAFANIGGPGTYSSADIVFNPVDNQIYGWSGNPKLLFKIDPTSGVQTKIPGNAPLAINNWSWTGALYFNAQGDILGYQGTKMIKIDPNTGIGYLVGTGTSKSNNDGCSCSFGVEMTKSVTGTFRAGDTITYHFQFFNQSFSPITNTLVFDDVLASGFTWNSNPYNLDNIELLGNTNIVGTSSANFTIDTLPKGTSSFSIDVVIPCNYNSSTYTNQATLSNLPAPLKDSIWSDNPNTLAINDPTTFTLTDAPLIVNTFSNNIICNRSTGSIEVNATGGAQPLSYLWDNGQDSSVTTGLAAGIYTLTISGSTGCTSTISADVIAENIILNTSITTQNVACNGESNGLVDINNTLGGYSPYSYSLNGISYNDTIQFLDLAVGNYTIYTKDSFGCLGQVSFTLTQPQFRLDIEAPNDTTLLLGDLMAGDIQQNTLTPVVYQWTPTVGLSCDNCKSPMIKALETTTYSIMGMDIQGCYDSTSFTVQVNDAVRVFVPNAFSPNNDGNNDILILYSPGDVQKVKVFRVFDRWGEMVFEQQNFAPNYPAYGWDGRFQGQLMNTGVFIYMAEVLLVDGRTKIVTGDVTLIR